MASSAARSSRTHTAASRNRTARRSSGGGKGRSFHIPFLSLFNGQNVPAEVMGPRLLVAVSAIALTIIGIVMVFSASSIEAISDPDIGDPTYFWVRQLGFAVIGGVLAVVFVRFVPYQKWLGRVGAVYYVVCLILVLMTAAMGLVGLGARRWLSIGGVTLQPSEFMKIALMLATVRFMLEYNEGSIDGIAFSGRLGLFVVLPVAFMFIAQSDLGTTMICLVGILAILWVGGVPTRYILGIIAAGVLLVALSSMSGYRADRWIFLDPWSDYYGSGFQVIHSFYAFAQGGLFGQGLGNSAEKYLYLPEAETDFIFSIIGEELGFIGAFAVVALFVAFLVGGLRMGQTAAEDSGTLICVGLSVMLVFQAFLNMGMCLGLLPTTGKPLPFISAGGSSLIASLMIVGIMLSVSYSTDDSVYQRRRRNLRLLRVDQGQDAGSARSRRRSSGDAARSGQSGWFPRRSERTDRADRGAGERRPTRRSALDRASSRERSESVHRRRSARGGDDANNGSLHIVNDYHIPRNGQRDGGHRSSRNGSGYRSGRRM